MLKSLTAAGGRLILATSKPQEFARRILTHFSLHGYFLDVCGSELDGTRAQKGDVIAFAMERNNICDPAAAVMVGDRRHDIQGAHRCKMEAVGVLYGYGSRRELTDCHADFLAQSVSDLAALLT